MSSPNEIPTYNLKAVIRETGLKPDTLRAWERRYGLPRPQRTSGRHRLYSARDVETIKWLITRQQSGMNISRAVDLWHRLQTEGKDPLESVEHLQPEALDTTISFAQHDAIADLRSAWVSASLAFDESKSERILSQAFSLYSPEVVCVKLIQKGLAEIGTGWYQGQVTIPQEHFASALAIRRLDSLLAGTPPPTRSGRILMGCPPDEQHTFAPLLLTLLLRRRGWDVLYLGASVPLAQLKATTASVKPKLVVMSTQHLYPASGLLEMAQLLQEQNIPLAFGGLVFNRLPELHNRIPGHYLGDRLDLAVQTIEQLIESPRPSPPTQLKSARYQQALLHYREQQALIEGQVSRKMIAADMPQDLMSTAIINMARVIVAALKLNDVSFMEADITWAEGLISNYDQPGGLLYHFLQTYQLAAETHMDERGSLLTDQLVRVARQFESSSK